MAKKPYTAVDLFCGAGGTSTGLQQACEDAGRRLQIAAVNHWERAVETHAANHPSAAHFCQDLTRLRPLEVVPKGKLDLLVASPECTHHSNARGGRPKNDQSRASAWIVLEWLTALCVDRFLIENVPEFTSWGPLDAHGKPIKSKRGHIFGSFIDALKKAGFRVEWRILNAADYGAFTTRRRLFIQGARGKRPIVWPTPTHSRSPGNTLFGPGLMKWNAAREIIDWNLPGASIFNRKKSLSPNTLARIEAGLIKFGGKNAEPFLVAMNYLKERGNDNRSCTSLNDPLPTITGQGNRFAFILPHRQFERMDVDSVDNPMRTITATNGRCNYVVQAFMADMRGTDADALERTARSLDEPHPTITAGGSHTAIVEPFMVEVNHGGGTDRRTGSVDEPLGTVTTKRGTALVEPFIMRACNGGYHDCRVKSPDEPLGTIHAGGGSYGVVEPFMMQMSQSGSNGDRLRSIGDPLAGVTTADDFAVCEPFTVPYYGTSGPSSVEDPMATVTTKDRFALVEPRGQNLANDIAIDIRFRMLQPEELMLGMGFPRDYKILGNREERVKQIGNAVEVRKAKAIASAFPELAGST